MNTTTQEAQNDYSILAEEYQQLSDLETLSFSQEERLGYIVNLAIDNPDLDRLIQDVELSSLSEQDRHEILNQQAKMREYLIVNYQRSLCPQNSDTDAQSNIDFANRQSLHHEDRLGERVPDLFPPG